MYITDIATSICHKGKAAEEGAMKARILIESASLGPADLKIAFQAFDGAWALISSRYTNPGAIETARMRLATLILSLAPDTKDAAEMQAIAVQEMTKGD
jgi:hypothetical protein